MSFIPSRLRCGTIIFSATLCLLIGWLTASSAPGKFDLEILRLIGGFASHHQWFADIARLGSFAGNVSIRVACILVTFVVMLFLRDRAGAIFVLVAPLGGWAFFSFLKCLINRPRPLIFFHLDHVSGASFPSGHSTNTMIVYPVVALLIRRHGGGTWWIYLSIAIALFVGFSRIALAVHWPSDVLGGWTAGFAWLLICCQIWDRWAIKGNTVSPLLDKNPLSSTVNNYEQDPR
ncbi:MAG: phosphatase PAP2 family protein [Zymomonas mobilis subsp. pomaceae]|uniref:Phosphoesterase PA-phosphatase related protein n=1 Tax=Zymomonas mobilis subsp. pomaceae (strain ATCC 29192 / DSM 22645 / JCM 10191 / CCUG 17912 / NBRC 13757 / NCIMB 11200 / NRRL B-4491 / Barker I) TaxID=579138 RepID=F8ES32_ZYMMT|nr:phosphatase PAP2 family protein [Zymomonas mobilis]AEI37607.1 phosphoesterase PA-phosphatase related protein [Zymomonas mobilis subsp. pomaceae ATCC 29192]MDX5948975.1 phosphatase PAP2 family protein [Zymomonas mobilis subsp. pomaceae]GEB88780.1 phosphatase PAP2 family protein [Zymomonas mobilis subsp. pomaceae]